MKCKRIGYIDEIFYGESGTHTTSFWKGERWLCTCPSFYYRKRCKHLQELLNKMTVFDIDEILNSDSKGAKRFPSSLKVVNNLFDDDAYNSNQMSAVYGKPSVGKTLFAIQEAVYLSSLGYNIFFIDTEGSLIPMLRKWVPVLEKRFGKRKGKILIESKKNVETLLEFLGYKVILEYKMADKKKQKGKLEFKVLESIDSKLEELIKKQHIDFVILDSLTSPLRSFTKEQQNYPARSDCTAFILRALVKFQEEYNIGVLITHHATFNPTNPYETMASATGGVVVQYYCKRFIYIDKRDAAAYKNYRRFWLVRGENAASWSKAGVTEINDIGYNDVLDETIINNVFTLSEQGKLSK